MPPASLWGLPACMFRNSMSSYDMKYSERLPCISLKKKGFLLIDCILIYQCDTMVEEYEDVIEDWYKNHQEEDLSQFLCANHVLKGKDTSELLSQG